MSTLSGRILTWIVVWSLCIVGLRLTLLAPEVCPTVTASDARSGAVAAATWIESNQAPAGTYLYEWDRSTSEASNAYNLVRHAGTTMALYQIVLGGEASFLTAADRGVEWLLDRDIARTEVLAIAADGSDRAKLGTGALVTVGLVHRRRATGSTDYDAELERLGRFIVGQQRDDGSMLDGWSASTGAPVPDETSLFATGEALWALALLHEIFPDAGFDLTAWRTLDYMATQRDEDEDVWPRPWADQWAAYALNEMAPWGLTDDHIAYAEALAAQFGIAVRWESQRNGGIDGLVHKPEPIAAGQGTWLEALAMFESLSRRDERLTDQTSVLGERLLCGAGRMVDKQTRGTGVVQLDGAWFVHDVARVDGQQHALSGLLFASELLAERDGGDES